MAFTTLLHFDGADLSTTITNNGSGAGTWTRQGTSTLKTDQFKFGTASFFDNATGYINSTNTGGLPTSTGWTLEFWTRYNSLASTSGLLFVFGSTSGIDLALSATGMVLSLSSNGSSYDIVSNAAGTKTSYAINQWYHIALVRDKVAGKYYLYIDGVKDIEVTSASEIFAGLTEWRVGQGSGSSTLMHGWIDEFSIQDSTIYPGGTTFTPPTSAYTPGFSMVGSGGALAGGAGFVVEVEYIWTGSGGALAGGAGAVVGGDTIFDYIPSGGAVAGGSADVVFNTPIPVSGTIAATLPKMLAAVVGVDQPLAFIDAQLPALSSVICGGVVAIDAKLPALSAQITALTGVLGTIDARLTLLQPAINVTTPVVATISARFPNIEANIGSRQNVVGTISAVVASFRAQMRGYAGVVGTISAALPKLSSALSSRIDVTGTISASMASMLSNIGAEIPAAQIGAFVMNTITAALSEYQQFPFNSFADFNGAYYAAGSSGIVALDGAAKDEGANIVAHAKSGLLDFGSDYMKHLENVYATMRANGPVTCKISVDEGAQYSYTLDPLAVTALTPRRVKIGKGLRGKNFQFEYLNVAGSSFEFDTISADVAIHPTRRL